MNDRCCGGSRSSDRPRCSGMRATVVEVSAPIRIGGPVGSAGRGPMSTSWNEKYRPSNEAGPSLHSKRIASMLSASRVRRLRLVDSRSLGLVGAVSLADAEQGGPGDMASMVATCSAISTGLWYGQAGTSSSRRRGSGKRRGCDRRGGSAGRTAHRVPTGSDGPCSRRRNRLSRGASAELHLADRTPPSRTSPPSGGETVPTRPRTASATCHQVGAHHGSP